MGDELDATDPIPLVDFKADYAKHGLATTEAMTAVVRSGQFILGPQVRELEEKLSAYLQPDATSPRIHTVGVSDGTAALQLCLLALGIGKGHEVITTPFSWVSTAEVIPLVGATPVFADLEPDGSYNLAPAAVAARVTKATRAVIAVSLFGLPPDFIALRAALDEAEKRVGCGHIAIIEDAAQSFGARRAGALSCASPLVDLATTSFFPTKPLAGYGDGGAVFTADDTLAQTVRELRVHGKTKDGQFARIGLNSRLDTVQAAVLLTKLPHFDDALAARQRAAERYTRMLQDDNRVVLPTYLSALQQKPAAPASAKSEDNDPAPASTATLPSRCAWGVYTVRVARRDDVIKRMRDASVHCAVYYKTCIHMQPAYAQWRPAETATLQTAETAARSALALPMHAYLSEAAQVRVAHELRTVLDDLGVTGPPE